MSKLKPVNGNLVLRPIEEEEQMAGNIIIPDMGKERPDMGEIISISPVFNFNTNENTPTILEKGMKVLIPKMGAQNITINNEDYWVTGVMSVIAILED
tara:strand:- start:2779 stop:3072 length:294 start_codon:yes stop_codon:yes gene_type:complete